MICPTCKQSIACPACAADLPNTQPAVREPLTDEVACSNPVGCGCDPDARHECVYGITGAGNG